MTARFFTLISRFIAFPLSFAIAFGSAPAYALRAAQKVEAGLEELASAFRTPNAPIYSAGLEEKTPVFDLLAQRITPVAGAQTGQLYIGAAIAAGINGIIAGHSETRPGSPTPINDSDQDINAQIRSGVDKNMRTIILAVGEKQEATTPMGLRARNSALTRQLKKALQGLLVEQLRGRLIVAYEPRWAIGGSGGARAASPEYAQSAHQAIRRTLRTLYGDLADTIRIIYGGSANAQNAADFLNRDDIDGLLIGGASISTAKLIPIVKVAQGIAVEKKIRTNRVLYLGGNQKTYDVPEPPPAFVEALAFVNPSLVQIGIAPTYSDLPHWRAALITGLEETQIFDRIKAVQRVLRTASERFRRISSNGFSEEQRDLLERARRFQDNLMSDYRHLREISRRDPQYAEVLRHSLEDAADALEFTWEVNKFRHRSSSRESASVAGLEEAQPRELRFRPVSREMKVSGDEIIRFLVGWVKRLEEKREMSEGEPFRILRFSLLGKTEEVFRREGDRIQCLFTSGGPTRASHVWAGLEPSDNNHLTVTRDGSLGFHDLFAEQGYGSDDPRPEEMDGVRAGELLNAAGLEETRVVLAGPDGWTPPLTWAQAIRNWGSDNGREVRIIPAATMQDVQRQIKKGDTLFLSTAIADGQLSKGSVWNALALSEELNPPSASPPVIKVVWVADPTYPRGTANGDYRQRLGPLLRTGRVWDVIGEGAFEGEANRAKSMMDQLTANGTVSAVSSAAGLEEAGAALLEPGLTAEDAAQILKALAKKWGLADLPQLRIAALTPKAALAHPNLRKLIGKPVVIGDAVLAIVPEKEEDMVDLLISFMDEPQDIAIQGVGGREDSILEIFERTARRFGLDVSARMTTETREFLKLLRQIIANLSGTHPDAIEEDDLIALEQVLSVLA